MTVTISFVDKQVEKQRAKARTLGDARKIEKGLVVVPSNLIMRLLSYR